MNITVVVLHYENIKDTRECLDSLKKYLDDTKNNINILTIYLQVNWIFIKEKCNFTDMNNTAIISYNQNLNGENTCKLIAIVIYPLIIPQDA